MILKIIGIRALTVVSETYLVLIPRVIPEVFMRYIPKRLRHKLLRKELAAESAEKARTHTVKVAPVKGVFHRLSILSF